MNQDVFDQCNEANEQIKTKVDGENVATIKYIFDLAYFMLQNVMTLRRVSQK